MFLDFVPYQINSRAPDGCSCLWFVSEVDSVLVSISNMNQENKRASVIAHTSSTASHVSETFSADGICYFTTTRGILRRPSNHCLLSLLERKSFIFNCGKIEHNFSALASRSAVMRAVLRSSACLVPIKYNHCLTIVLCHIIYVGV